MNKKDLILEIAIQSQMQKKDVEKVLLCFFDTVGNKLAKQEKIMISGFGTFEVYKRKARTGINPRNGKCMTIEKANVPKFKASRALKERINL